MLNAVSSKNLFIGIAAATVFTLTSVAWADPRGNAGGASADHVSEQGAANANGQAATDHDKGAARAAERRSEQGAAHTKSGDHKTKAAKHKKEKP